MQGAVLQQDRQVQNGRAKEVLRNQVADLAVQGAQKILSREINPAVHADLLNQLKAEL